MWEYYGLVIVGLAALLWGFYCRITTQTGAPFVPSTPQVTEKVIELAKLRKGEIFYDLGSGDGRLVIAAALKGTKAIGVEIDLLRVWYSRIWLKLLRLNDAKIIRKNFFEISLKDADVVCLFLLQKTNEMLQTKLEKELKKGTRVISIAFNFPGWQPESTIANVSVYGPIYLYRM